MGNCISNIKRRKEPNKAITLAIIGLDNAGKTTLCYVLTGEQLDPDLAPTVGFRNVKFSHSNFDVTLFDVGGGENIRPIWKTYFGEVFGLMYVVDSSTPSRLSEAGDIFKNTLEHPQVSGKPVLILANKVDKEGHMKEDDIISGLNLDNTKNTSKCPSKMVMVSALSGVGSKMDKGIQGGLLWLFESIRKSLSSLEPRIEQDMKAAQMAKEKEKEERKARVKKQREEREKAEELERSKLGLGKKDDSDEDDIIIGDPFKALDIEKLKKKEQQLKEEKLIKQERIKTLTSNNESSKEKEDESVLSKDDENNKTIGSDHSVTLKNLTISEGLTLHLDDVDTSAMPIFGRGTPASALPPLEPVESRYQENLALHTGRKKQRKKKKLTDYHLMSHNQQPHDNDLNMPHKGDVTELSPRLNVLSNSKTDAHDETSQIDKSKKKRIVKAGKVSDNEEEMGLYKDNERIHSNEHNDSYGQNYSNTQMTNDVSPSFPESKDKNNFKSYDTESHGSGDSNYRKSKQRVDVPNWNGLTGIESDEGIDVSNRNNLDSQSMKLQNRLDPIGKPRKSDKDETKKNSPTNLLSDEENNSYASHSTLKDTLRFPLSPAYVEDLRTAHNGINEQHSHRLSKPGPQEGIENGGFMGRRNKEGEDGNDLENSKNFRRIQSSEKDEEDAHTSRPTERSDIRRKKKHNFLRLNKVAPSQDESLKSVSEEMAALSHVKNERGSNSLQDIKSSSKNRNTTVTSHQRDLLHDSDFNAKWGLAEDLPAVDGDYGGFRVPNFDSNDEDDTGL